MSAASRLKCRRSVLKTSLLLRVRNDGSVSVSGQLLGFRFLWALLNMDDLGKVLFFRRFFKCFFFFLEHRKRKAASVEYGNNCYSSFVHTLFFKVFLENLGVLMHFPQASLIAVYNIQCQKKTRLKKNKNLFVWTRVSCLQVLFRWVSQAAGWSFLSFAWR